MLDNPLLAFQDKVEVSVCLTFKEYHIYMYYNSLEIPAPEQSLTAVIEVFPNKCRERIKPTVNEADLMGHGGLDKMSCASQLHSGDLRVMNCCLLSFC